MAQIKLMIELGEEGWDGSASEVLWVNRTTDGFVIDNLPFFKKGLCYQDIVEGAEITDGLYRFNKILRKSSNSLYRAIFSYEKSSSAQQLLQRLEKIGCIYASNKLDQVCLVAVNIPEFTNADEAWSILEEGRTLEIWEIQEGDDRHE